MRSMRHSNGFTLIELMIVVAVIALLAAIGYPSYRDHVARGQRSQGQQFLSDIAQRQEQFLLDRRAYASDWAPGVNGLGLQRPDGLKYDDPVVTVGAAPPTFQVCMNPTAGSNLAARNDGRLCINSVGQRWREALSSPSGFDSGTDCPWESRSCPSAVPY